ncbi:MAG TPA: hypothetical protein VG276_06535 [Actinomycetes bacterium]|nr:hypothetical protein [Actinomycetes bacterium]
MTRDTKTGWSQTHLTDQLAERYAAQLAGLDAALGLWRHTERQHGPATVAHNLLACSCACGRKLRVAKATLEQAPILCGGCEQPFEPERALTLSRQSAAPPHLPERHPQPGSHREQATTVWPDPERRPAREGGHER